eukprot:6192117-Pleurochrysis_carterae.AAC.3
MRLEAVCFDSSPFELVGRAVEVPVVVAQFLAWSTAATRGKAVFCGVSRAFKTDDLGLLQEFRVNASEVLLVMLPAL